MVGSFVRFFFTRCEESLNSLVRCAHSFVRASRNSWRKIVRTHQPWSNLYFPARILARFAAESRRDFGRRDFCFSARILARFAAGSRRDRGGILPRSRFLFYKGSLSAGSRLMKLWSLILYVQAWDARSDDVSDLFISRPVSNFWQSAILKFWILARTTTKYTILSFTFLSISSFDRLSCNLVNTVSDTIVLFW